MPKGEVTNVIEALANFKEDQPDFEDGVLLGLIDWFAKYLVYLEEERRKLSPTFIPIERSEKNKAYEMVTDWFLFCYGINHPSNSTLVETEENYVLNKARRSIKHVDVDTRAGIVIVSKIIGGKKFGKYACKHYQKQLALKAD